MAGFGATATRVLVSVAEPQADEVFARARDAGVPARLVGRTGGTRFRVSVDGEVVIDRFFPNYRIFPIDCLSLYQSEEESKKDVR